MIQKTLRHVALLAWIAFGITAPAPAGSPPPLLNKVPVIYCTDLFHPHDDPDDHFDIATLYALGEIEVLGIVLDQGRKQEQQPGRIPIEQLNHLTGRKVPWAVGLADRLERPDDPGTDQPEQYQKGVQLILDALAASRDPVTIIAVGSLRDVAAARNRNPDLFRKKVRTLLVFIGATRSKKREWNVNLDPNAFIAVMSSGLPIRWVPCFDGGNFRNQGQASFWRARHMDLLARVSDPVMNFFIYALRKKTDPDSVGFLSRPVDPADRKLVLDATRNLWCTAVFTSVAGRVIVHRDSTWMAVPPGDLHGGEKAVQAFAFEPVWLSVDRNARIIEGKTPTAHRVLRYRIATADQKQYAAIMTSVTADLLGRLGAPEPGGQPSRLPR
jgi:inosine-uridine preferring nucleoside hydrolase